MKTAPKILLAVVGVVIAAGVVWWLVSGRDGVRQIAFDSTAWQRADPIENHRTVRSQMIQDLLRRQKFEGWTRQQVVALLGEPTQGKPAKMGFPQWDAVYILGLERQGGYSLDDEALGFKFDTTDRVTSYGLSVN
ncbi:MAG: hypothetical protein ACO1QS_19230 [Verrucomicrobiota bacterium]